MQENPLGKPGKYAVPYDPGLLFPVARAESRAAFTDPGNLPFDGEDIWNAWEICWLDLSGKPQIATGEIRVPATSANLVESKSLKLYLNSHANERYAEAASLATVIEGDLSAAADAEVKVVLRQADEFAAASISTLSGECIDDQPIESAGGNLTASSLRSDADDEVSEILYSHLFRSNCPVTNQPDTGSVVVVYEGTRINRSGLLQYLVSYRDHNAFHEDCVERIFVDIKTRCAPRKLTVYARFNRRGGLDINPFRSNYETRGENLRLWRQ